MDIDIVDIDHIAIRVSNLDNSLEFYKDILNIEPRDIDRYEKNEVPFIALKTGGRHIHLVPVKKDFEIKKEHICFLVRSSSMETKSEAEEMVEKLKKIGVKVESGEPKKRYGAYGRDWAIYIRDPDERRVELKLH